MHIYTRREREECGSAFSLPTLPPPLLFLLSFMQGKSSCRRRAAGRALFRDCVCVCQLSLPRCSEADLLLIFKFAPKGAYMQRLARPHSFFPYSSSFSRETQKEREREGCECAERGMLNTYSMHSQLRA